MPQDELTSSFENLSSSSFEQAQSIFITGGTGFFGRALLRQWKRLADRGSSVPQVTVGTRSPAVFLRQFPEFSHCAWLRFLETDILHVDSFPFGTSFTHVLHAATDSTLGPALTPLQYYDQIVSGTRNVLDFAVRSGSKRLLLTSSGAVYGPQASDVVALDETCLNSPDSMLSANAYGMGKRAAEHLCALYSHQYGLDTVVARCFAFVGPDLPLNVHYAIGNFIRDAILADHITVRGDGSPLRSYMDQRDLAYWLLTILYKGRSGEAYNVGSDHAVSVGELAHTVRDLIAPDKLVHVLGQPDLGAPRNRYIPSIAKAQEDLGLRVTVGLEEAIRFAADAHLHKIKRP